MKICMQQEACCYTNLQREATGLKKVAKVPTGFGLYWLRNFSLFRKLTLRPECVEVLIKDSGDIIAMSAGKMWSLSSTENVFRQTMSLTHYGKGDQGIFENGILAEDDSAVFLANISEISIVTRYVFLEVTITVVNGRCSIVLRQVRSGIFMPCKKILSKTNSGSVQEMMVVNQ